VIWRGKTVRWKRAQRSVVAIVFQTGRVAVKLAQRVLHIVL
jgi:hypothetical protein